MYFSQQRAAFLVACWLTAPAVLLADPPVAKKARKTEPAKFLRIIRDSEEQPLALQTATVRYVPASQEGDLIVDLIGVVHVADAGYYHVLNHQFKQYDVLLYELVAPKGTRIPKGGKRSVDNPLVLVQQIMKIVLDLDLQTEVIDYTRPNFVHADLSPEEIKTAIKKRGDDGLTLLLSIAADLLRQQNLQNLERQNSAGKSPLSDTPDLSAILFDPAGPVKLKRIMAEQFEQMTMPGGGLGPTLNAILIADRNQAAMKVFKSQLAKGKKKIGIFYGAAHMPDFDKRLREEFGLKPESVEWQTAWDLQPRDVSIEQIFKLIELLSQLAQPSK